MAKGQMRPQKEVKRPKKDKADKGAKSAPASFEKGLSVTGETMTTGGFIFGPYPDIAYDVLGTYYQRSILTSTNTVTWMTSEIPFALLEGCLASVSKFLKDPASEQAHMADMAELLEDIVLADKASRYAGGSLVINCV